MFDELNKENIIEIKRYAREKIGECRKDNDIIGTQIFSILSLYARTIYYPLGKEAPWGFTRICGVNNKVVIEKPFVAINSSIPIDCQVFAAAHELYHIWYEHNPKILKKDLLDETDKNLSEKKANRFAAEFLVDELLLKKELEFYNISNIDMKIILKLSELFMVPYRTMVKRLKEINMIDNEQYIEFINVTDELIEKYMNRYSIVKPESNERIVMDNLVELSIKAYEKGCITFEKLEYLLEMNNLKPEDVGIEQVEDYKLPSDDELDIIMEE